MRRQFEMKQYIIDQMIQLIIFIIMIIGFYRATCRIFFIMLLIETLIICSGVYLLKSLLALPLDLLQGCTKQDVYFSKVSNIDEYEFLGKKYYCEWDFTFSSKGKLTLLVPVCLPHEEIMRMKTPAATQKVSIYYYKHSKILCAWEPL